MSYSTSDLLVPVLSALALLVVLAAGSVIFHSIRCGISPMPSSPAAARAVIGLLREDRSSPAAGAAPAAAGESGCRILELGSGWGNLVLALSAAFPECRISGMEISPVPFAVSCAAAAAVRLRAGCRRIDLRRGDFSALPLGEADAVVCYLFPVAMERLSHRFRRELSPGTKVVSIAFALPGWIPERTIRLDDLFRTPVYRYRVPPGARLDTPAAAP